MVVDRETLMEGPLATVCCGCLTGVEVDSSHVHVATSSSPEDLCSMYKISRHLYGRAPTEIHQSHNQPQPAVPKIVRIVTLSCRGEAGSRSALECALS